MWSKTTSYRPGTEHESIYYKRVYVPKSAGPLSSCVGRRRENNLLYPVEESGSGRMRIMFFLEYEMGKEERNGTIKKETAF